MCKGIKKSKLIAILVVFSLVLSFMPCSIAFAAASGAPGKPVLQHNQYGTDYDGNYTITMSMYYGNNATSYKLYEQAGAFGEFKVIKEGTLTDNTPAVQSTSVEIVDRKGVNTFRYKAEFINSFGSTFSDVISVRVGKDGNTPIVIDGVDNESIMSQMTISQGKSTYKLANTNNANAKFSVISSNTSTVQASVENNVLTLNGVKDGRSGLKITDESTGEIRQIGVRVRKADGSLPGMPDYLSLGQVSEDTDADLNFWKETSNTDTNKFVDVRYIYVNGGPFGGWRSWTTEDGDRVKSYLRESLKLGMIPFFVYYNIPDSGESYDLDIKHINDKSYMEGYYSDLKYFLDLCKEYAGDETVGMIFEPDFIGYMMQQSNKQPSEISALVDCAYSSGVLDKDKDPAFDNTVEGLVKSINYIVRKYHKPAYFGWQFNIWSYDSHEIPSQGLLHKTEFLGWEEGRKFIKDVATETANYYKAAGITTEGADFISIDKYGLDGGYEENAATDPKTSKWLWNADIWNNYLLYTKTLHEVTEKPVILWQIPVGHLNHSNEPNPYNGGEFADLTNKDRNYEDSAPDFFFGDTFTPGAGNRFNYFSSNAANDPKIKTSGDKVTWGDHMQETLDAGVVSILFGAGVNSSTDAVGSPASDDYWWITKAQRYLKNPLPLPNKGGSGSETTKKLPLKGSISCTNPNNTGNYTIKMSIPSNSNATSYELKENNKVVSTGTVDNSAKTINFNVTNKAKGSYSYTLDLINSDGRTSSNTLTVVVGNSTEEATKPLQGTITVDKANNDGNYTVTAKIPANSNATKYNVLENDKVIKTGTVTTASQEISIPFTNKEKGAYTYKLELVNANGSTYSDSIIVTSTPSSSSSNGVKVDLEIGSDWGTGANFTITITNNSGKDLEDWSLSFEFDKKINSLPDANITSNGNKYTVTPKSWNGTLKNGEKLTLSGGCEGNASNASLKNVEFTSSSLSTVEGDLNNDNVVDALDISMLAMSYNLNSTDNGFNSSADFDGNGLVDLYDLVYLAKKILL